MQIGSNIAGQIIHNFYDGRGEVEAYVWRNLKDGTEGGVVAKTAKVHFSAYLAKGSEVNEKANVGPEVYASDGVSVGRGSVLKKEVYLYPRVRVADDTRIGPRSVLHDYVYVGPRVQLGPDVRIDSGAIIGHSSKLKGHNFIGARASLSSCTVVPKDGEVAEGVWVPFAFPKKEQ